MEEEKMRDGNATQFLIATLEEAITITVLWEDQHRQSRNFTQRGDSTVAVNRLYLAVMYRMLAV